MKAFALRWIVTAFAVFVAAPLVGIHYEGLGCLFAAALLLGVANAFVRPVILLMSLPLVVFSLGFFILIVNALLLYLVSVVLPCFHVEGFGRAFLGAILISIVSWLVSAFFKGNDGRIYTVRSRSEMKRVSGKVIDI